MATASDLITYQREVVHFLQSLTLKYTPLATAANAALRARGAAVDDTDPASWKYYRNLLGEYHPTDTMMTVVSLDTQLEVAFTKATLAAHPKTAAAYRPGRPEYDALCAKYPDQVDLIKSILYPVSDVNFAIAAEEFTILAHGTGFLEEAERAPLLHDLGELLTYVRERWYMDWLGYEAYFYWAFWGMLWQMLALWVFALRIRYLHTAAAHSYHIWQYLSSHGIGDYRDILTRRQALWLYRNIRYIRDNRGKQATLRLLVDQLLRELSVGLVAKVIHQGTTERGAPECRWVPEITSETVPTQYADVLRQVPIESLEEITQRLFKAGDEVDMSLAHVEQLSRTIGATTLNTLPTKLLEIRPVLLDRKYADLLNNFLLDTLVACVVTGRYTTTVDFVEAQTGVRLRLSAADTLALVYYCVQKAKRLTPEHLPTTYWPSVQYKFTQPSPPALITYRGHRYPLRQLVDAERFTAGVGYPLAPFHAPEDFSTFVGEQFACLARQVWMSRLDNSAVGLHALHTLFDAMTERQPYHFALAAESTYAAWLAAPAHDLRHLVAVYDASAAGPGLYGELADTLLQQLVPLTVSSLLRYSNLVTTETLYGRLKELFVQLCSYNVRFLDTPRETPHWILGAKIVTDIEQAALQATVEFDPVGEPAVHPWAGDRIAVPVVPDTYAVDYAVGQATTWAPRPALAIARQYHAEIVVEADTEPQATLTLTQRVGVPSGVGVTVVPPA